MISYYAQRKVAAKNLSSLILIHIANERNAPDAARVGARFIAPVGMGQAIHRAQCLTPNLRLPLNTVYSVGISEQRTQVTASCVGARLWRLTIYRGIMGA